MKIPIDKIKPSPYQPRLLFDLEDIRGSIQKDGILVALTIRKKDGFYELVDGERRLRLAKELGYKEIKCDVIDVDDDVARRMVWKVNTLRKDYTPKEKAYHFKRLQKMGMSVNAIALDCDTNWHLVTAHLNVLKLPEGKQKLVWSSKKLTVTHIQELEDLFNGLLDSKRIDKWITQTLEQKLTSKELREARRPELKEIERRRVESAKKAVGKIEADVKEPESAEELEKAAQALKREAKKKRDAKLSPEEKAKREAEKQRKKEEQKRKREEKKRLEEEKRKQREAKIREEAKNELLHNQEFIKKAAEIAPQIKEIQPKVTLRDLGIPSVSKQIEDFYNKLPPSKQVEREVDREALIKLVTAIIKKLECPICGETKILWKCGHEFN